MTQPEFYSSAINATDCISNGWNLTKQNYWLYFGISIVALLMVACIPCINIFIAGPVTAGIYYCFLRGIRSEPVDLGMLFKGFDNFVPAMVVGLIAAIPEIIGQVLRLILQFTNASLRNGGREQFQATNTDMLAGGLLIIIIVISVILLLAGIALRISLYFALPLIVEHNLGVGDAIRLSARAGWSNVGGIIILAILEGLIGIAAMFALCIGFLFVLPILYAANAFAYRQVFPDTKQGDFPNMPPPPTAYGGNYGVGL